jgi:hypothetical protein
MVALCRDHHPEADAGAFTKEEVRRFKVDGRDRSRALGARFNWMRESLLAVVGGNLYYETPIAIRISDIPIVWFERDPSRRLLVNLQMVTTSGEPRMVMLDNFWMTEGRESDIQCPPSGRLVRARYPNGDQLKIEFREIDGVEELDRRYQPEVPAAVRERFADRGIPLDDTPASYADPVARSGVKFPLAAVEITMKVAGTGLDLGPRATTLPGHNVIAGGWISGCQVGIQLGEPSSGGP